MKTKLLFAKPLKISRKQPKPLATKKSDKRLKHTPSTLRPPKRTHTRKKTARTTNLKTRSHYFPYLSLLPLNNLPERIPEKKSINPTKRLKQTPSNTMPTTMPRMRYFFCKSPTRIPTMCYFSNTRKHTITNQTRTKCMFEIPQPHEVKTKNSHTFYLAHTAIPTKNYSFSFPAVGICPFFNNNSATYSRPNCTAIIRSYRPYNRRALRSRGRGQIVAKKRGKYQRSKTSMAIPSSCPLFSTRKTLTTIFYKTPWNLLPLTSISYK